MKNNIKKLFVTISVCLMILPGVMYANATELTKEASVEQAGCKFKFKAVCYTYIGGQVFKDDNRYPNN